MKSLLLCFCLAAVFLSSASSEDAKLPPPTEPFIKKVPLPGAWTITFTRPAEEETVDMAEIRKLMITSLGPDSPIVKSLENSKPFAKPMVRTMVVTKTSDFAKEAVKYSDETTQTSYVFNVARITKHIAFDGLIRSRTAAEIGSYTPNYTKEDFQGFEWLSLKNYKEIQPVQGRPCYVFESEQESAPNPLFAADKSTKDSPKLYRAYIDVETKLPVALQTGKETRVYAFSPPTAADLTLPPEVLAEIKDWRAELISATQAAPPP